MGEEAIAPFSSAFPKQESSQKTIASEVGMDREPNAVSPVNGGQPAATRILWEFRGLKEKLPDSLPLILGGWSGGAFLGFFPWIVGFLALYRLLRNSRLVEDGPWFWTLQEVCHDMGIPVPDLYRTDRCLAPMAGSFLHAFIIVPQEARLWSKEKMRNVLLHELGHIQRHDDLTYLPVRLVAALHWFNPLAWWLLRTLRYERERACDDFVLRQGIASCDYAGHLLEIVKDTSAAPHPAMLAAAPMATPRRLERRILAILNDKINRKGLTMRNLIGVMIVTAVVTLFIGAATVAETSAFSEMLPEIGTGIPESEPPAQEALTASAQEEVERYYKAAPKEVTDFIVWTEGQFKGTQWLPENAIDNMEAKAREDAIQQYVAILNEKPYNREICRALVMASVLRDKRFLPGLLKTAAYDELCDYDCCPKWMAVAALARMGDESAVPVLIPLVDHGNGNTRMWARAALVRLTGQTFDQDKKAWGAWWNGQNKEPRLSDEDLKPWVHIKTRWRSEKTSGVSAPPANAQEEIERSYKDASQEVKDYILWTEKEWQWIQWLPENSVGNMDADPREKAIARYVKVLNEKPYGRELCPALNMASVLRDKRFLPGLLKTAAYHEPVDYDCCPKWMAVAALARMGDESAVPVLIPLVDHGNENTRMWARAALVRLTGQTFDQDKKAWGAWWNAQNKEPKPKEEDLKLWSMPEATQAVTQPAPTPGAGRYPGAGAGYLGAGRYPGAGAGYPGSGRYPYPGYPGREAAYPQPAPTQPSGTPAASSAVPSSGLTANAQEEIERYYKGVPKEVTDFILKTEQMFRWPAENAFDGMDAETREKAIKACEKILNEVPYSRELCPALVQASVLRDKRLLPGLLKPAAYTNPSGNYDCRAKWMAIAALARMGKDAPNLSAGQTAEYRTVAEERFTVDNPEKMETFRNLKVRLIRIFDAPPAEVELAVGMPNRNDTQQVNLKVNASQTIDSYEILCEEIKVGGGKAGGSARILVRYKEPVEKAVVQTSPAEGSENREYEAAIPVLVPLVDFGNTNVRMWSRAALYRLTGQTFDQDKKAWGAWWNAQNKEPKLKEEDLKPWSMPGAGQPVAAAGGTTGISESGMTGSAQAEINRYYKAVPKEVTDFILVTERQFGGNLWFPENFIDSLDAETREKEIKYYASVLDEKPYSRQLCPALAKAGVLRDKRLLPGLLKVAAHTEPGNYDCRPKWMAVAALARMGDESAIPVLVPLVDFGNKNVQMWSRAALYRLTGQTFDQDKKEWGAWWNAQNKEPKLKDEDLKPWAAVSDPGAQVSASQ